MLGLLWGGGLTQGEGLDGGRGAGMQVRVLSEDAPQHLPHWWGAGKAGGWSPGWGCWSWLE